MGATVAMERSIEFRLLGFYTLCFNPLMRHALAGAEPEKDKLRKKKKKKDGLSAFHIS